MAIPTEQSKNEQEWLIGFDLGYHSSDRFQEAQNYEKEIDPISSQAEGYTTGKEPYEADREQQTLDDLRTLRDDAQDRDMEIDRDYC